MPREKFGFFGAAPMQPDEVIPAALRDLEAQLAEARALLREIADCGVAFDDWRLGYVEVQIDRPTWDALVAYRSSRESSDAT